MKNIITAVAAVLLCFGVLAGCTAENGNKPDANLPAQTVNTNKLYNAGNVFANTTAAYNKLISYMSDGYTEESVDKFNRSLTPDNGDLSEILQSHADALNTLSENDENYDFIKITLTASFDELYCEQVGDEIAYCGFVSKAMRPIEPLNEEEKKILNGETQHAFRFYCALRYSLHNC